MSETARAGSSRSGRLAEWRVVVTRPSHQAAPLVSALEAQGATAIELATIAIADPADGGVALKRAARQIATYDWVVFTSENAVERLAAEPDANDALRRVRVSAIGAGTAEALVDRGISVALVPERFIGEALVESFPRPDGLGRVLLPRAAVARDVVPEGLRTLGWEVDVVEAYRTVTSDPSTTARAAARRAEAITFTSSSTVASYVELFGLDELPPVVATIGPITSATASAAGMAVDVEAEVHSTDGLVGALGAWAARHGRPSLGRDRRS